MPLPWQPTSVYVPDSSHTLSGESYRAFDQRTHWAVGDPAQAMESHDEASTSDNTQQGRRLACERCRGQKLKCEKSNIPNCCQRCRKADVQCSFGLALPPGRPRLNPRPELSRKDHDHDHDHDHDRDRGRDLDLDLDLDQPLVDAASSPSFHPAHELTFGLPAAAAAAAAAQHHHLHHHHHHGDPFITDDGMIDAPYSDHLLTSEYTAWSVALAGPGSTDSSKPSDALMAMDHHMEHLHQHHALPDSFLMMDTRPATPPAQTVATTSNNSSSWPGSSAAGSRSSYAQQMQAPTSSLAALVRRAADLCDHMYELRIKYHQQQQQQQQQQLGGAGTSEPDAPGQFPVHMSGEVLQAANDFLALLRCFFWDEASSTSTSSSGGGGGGSSTTQSLLSNTTNTINTNTCNTTTTTTTTNAPSSSLSSSSSSSSSSSAAAAVTADPHQPPRRIIYDADGPAALTLIASYQRLLDLYLLYYQAVHAYLCGGSAHRRHHHHHQQRRRSPPIWKDLAVGGAALGEFGDLHMALVLQAAARVLADVEDALGLAAACRVSHPAGAALGEGGNCDGGGGGGGVLGAIVTARFVEQCIAEGFTGGGAEQGQGAIARIRDMAAGLMAALDTAGGSR